MNAHASRREFLTAAGGLALATRRLSVSLAEEAEDPPPAMPVYDVIVVGLGAMGAACLCELARRGVRVLALERFDIAHALGRSGGLSRQTNVLPYVGGRMEPLIRRANEDWALLEQDSGQRIFERCGYLRLGVGQRIPPAAGPTCEVLDAATLVTRYPQFVNLPAGTDGVVDRDGGLLRPELAIAAQCRVAVDRGAHVRAREAITSWSADSQGVEVVTTLGRYRGSHLVLAAGAWNARLVPALRSRLEVTRLSLGWFNPSTPAGFSGDRFPVWEHGAFYGFPILGDFPGLTVAKHWRGDPTEPDAVDREPRSSDESTAREYLSRHLRSADGDLVAIKICMYVHGGPWVGLLPGEKRVTAIAACNGGGFKFSPAYGEAAADFATTGRTDLPVGFMKFP